MHSSVTIFKNELLNCIDDLIDIMDHDFTGDPYAIKLSGELKVAKTIIVPLGENGIVEILEIFLNAVIPHKDRIEARDVGLFDTIADTDVLADLDSKTFKAIKMVMRKGKADDIKMAFDYIDSFIAAGEKYRMENKEKLN